MSTPFVVLLVAGLGLTGLAIWWLVFETEGVYLGRRVVVWLYDLYAGRYDSIKQNDEVDEHLHLAQPAMRHLHPHVDPMVLDVATGTGRIPLALCQHARFEGHIVALDLSQGMLRQAAEKIAAEHFTDYVTLLRANAGDLPFEDASFDFVTCMEALEFFPDPQRALTEIVRVLRPGGLLLITRRKPVVWMPGRIWSPEYMTGQLKALGIRDAAVEPWQVDYDQVWGRKQGAGTHIGPRMPCEIMHCPRCQATGLMAIANDWHCQTCGLRLVPGPDGIIDYFAQQNSY